MVVNEMTTSPAMDCSTRLFHSLAPAGWLHNEIDRLFDELAQPSRGFLEHLQQASGLPFAVEITRTEKEYQLTAEIPGLTDKDVEIMVVDNVLAIVGNKNVEHKEEEGGLLVSERRYCAFRRQVRLPGDVDADQIRATVKHGILTVSMPKDAKASKAHRRIEIGRD
jgi:HSP20 family protein